MTPCEGIPCESGLTSKPIFGFGLGSCAKIHPFSGHIFIFRWPFDLLVSRIEELVAPEMALLDEEMARIVGSDHPFLGELNVHTFSKPGKRLRPKLLILCGKMMGYQGHFGPMYAAVFELIHTATLIHDDIIDDAKTRRGQNTLNEMLGNTITVLYGDLLYTKAHTTAIEAGSLEVLHTITSVSERMIEGELLQNRINHDIEIDEATYFDILKRKTAYLFAGTTKAGGLMANATTDQVTALFEYGFNLGISFQLIDDYLDYMGNADVLGKPVLQDLREGKITLPLIRLLAKGDPLHRKLVQSFWAEPDAAVPNALLDALNEDDMLKDTWELAERYAKSAVGFLKGFPENPYTDLLQELPIQLLYRKK